MVNALENREKMMEIMTSCFRKYSVISLLISFEKMALQICQFIFPPKAAKAELSVKKHPAEQRPTSGIQTVANTGSKNSILLLLTADKVMLIKD